MPDLKQMFMCAIAIIVIVSVVAIGMIYLGKLREQTIETIINQVTNESSGAISSVPYLLNATNYPVVSGSETLYSYFANATGYIGTLVRNTNYTVLNYTTGRFNVTDLGGKQSADTKVNTTYKYTSQQTTEATGIVDKGKEGLIALVEWLGLIVLAIAGTLTLYMIIKGLQGLGFGGGGGE